MSSILTAPPILSSKGSKIVKILLWRKRRWLGVGLLILTILLCPYAFSRVISPWRQVTLHSIAIDEPQESPVTELGLACYNIAHGRGLATSNWEGGDRAERLARLDQIAELLKQMDADVVVLNEVDFDSSWSYSVNQAGYLAERAGYAYWAEERNLDFRFLAWKWRFGNAILSRYPIANAEVVDLPSYETWETVLAGKKRGVMCDIDLGDQTIRIIGAHLSHRSEALRVKSALLLASIASEGRLPTVVAGDLNSTAPGFPKCSTDPNGSNAIETLDSSGYFQRLPLIPPETPEELTFRSSNPSSIIDWVLIPPDWQFLQYSVELSELSDHRPICATVLLRE